MYLTIASLMKIFTKNEKENDLETQIEIIWKKYET